MEPESESVSLILNNELNKEVVLHAMEAHKHDEPYFTNSTIHGAASSSSSVGVPIIAFPSVALEVKDLYDDDRFGETDADRKLFPSLRRIGEDRPAKVNKALLQSFLDLLTNPGFKAEVKKAVTEKKKIILTGHSFGGATASFATLWILEEYVRKQRMKIQIACVTFGSPLIGDKTFSHSIRREKWADCFTHFVMEHDIVPRMMLAPKRTLQEHLPKILKFFQQKVNPTDHKSHKLRKLLKQSSPEKTMDHDQLVDADEAEDFFENVMVNASAVTSHVAFNLMEPTNLLMEKITPDYVELSPYRPSGVYIFGTRDKTPGQRQQLVVENPNAVLQLLFYFLQLTNEDKDLALFAINSLNEHLSYEEEVNNNGLQTQNRVYLKNLNNNLLSADGTSNKALSEMDVSVRCCLMAAEEAENRKRENEKQIDRSMKEYQSETDKKQKIIEDMLKEIHEYKDKHANGNNTDYYEAFKLQDEHDDFLSNVNRLELAKIFDEIVEMLVREDLPDEFECREKWVGLATEFRRLVEPLDIANYYRHAKGPGYLDVRPKRYKFTQRWYEHANKMTFEELSESNFVAVVEEIKKEVEETKKKPIKKVKEEMEKIEEQVRNWRGDEKIKEKDVFWGECIRFKLRNKIQDLNQGPGASS